MTDLEQRLVQLALRSEGATDLAVLPAFERATIWLRLLYYPTLAKKPLQTYLIGTPQRFWLFYTSSIG